MISFGRQIKESVYIDFLINLSTCSTYCWCYTHISMGFYYSSLYHLAFSIFISVLEGLSGWQNQDWIHECITSVGHLLRKAYPTFVLWVFEVYIFPFIHTPILTASIPLTYLDSVTSDTYCGKRCLGTMWGGHRFPTHHMVGQEVTETNQLWISTNCAIKLQA